eukprot:PLAT10338.1.p2 GENE.PLAT10338.1~~PLAT10338.1.p2  ORF type:complete len:184 (-),score=87.58 PLAT10338.1:736-1287(-)
MKSAAAICLLFAATALAYSCGHERWAVKTGTDPDAKEVDLNKVVVSNITYLTSIPAPSSLPADARIPPVETTQWQVTTTLTGYKHEDDDDYHLVITNSKGQTMIVEIPSPTCVEGPSPFLDGITKARKQFDAKFDPTEEFKTCNVPIVITGVGFFDFIHGQTGVAPNGIEIHPVLDVQFPSSD